jgi:hypothetical protein
MESHIPKPMAKIVLATKAEPVIVFSNVLIPPTAPAAAGQENVPVGRGRGGNSNKRAVSCAPPVSRKGERAPMSEVEGRNGATAARRGRNGAAAAAAVAGGGSGGGGGAPAVASTTGALKPADPVEVRIVVDDTTTAKSVVQAMLFSESITDLSLAAAGKATAAAAASRSVGPDKVHAASGHTARVGAAAAALLPLTHAAQERLAVSCVTVLRLVLVAACAQKKLMEAQQQLETAKQTLAFVDSRRHQLLQVSSEMDIRHSTVSKKLEDLKRNVETSACRRRWRLCGSSLLRADAC